jgi:hypothetical protein
MLIEARPVRFSNHYLTSTHNSSGGPAAHVEKREEARTPRAPAWDSVPCTPVYEWISDYYVDRGIIDAALFKS